MRNILGPEGNRGRSRPEGRRGRGGTESQPLRLWNTDEGGGGDADRCGQCGSGGWRRLLRTKAVRWPVWASMAVVAIAGNCGRHGQLLWRRRQLVRATAAGMAQVGGGNDGPGQPERVGPDGESSRGRAT